MTILALAGGVGGAKLAAGLAAVLPPEALVIAVNTGDDFEHLGLHIAPDLDSVTYTLAGLNDPVQGWGLAGESWTTMGALERFGGETWFRLGDQDLATHLFRTQALRTQTLSTVTERVTAGLGVRHRIVPMSDDRVRSVISTDEGDLPFQDYFVRRRCEPRFRSIRFEGVGDARPGPALLAALDHPALEAILLCPSNPMLSIAPILALPGLRERIEGRGVPVVAVSPFIAGRAVKGPAAKIMAELGIDTTPEGLARCYDGLLDGIVIDPSDAEAPRPEEVAIHVTPTLMRTPEDRERLARATLEFARAISPSA